MSGTVRIGVLRREPPSDKEKQQFEDKYPDGVEFVLFEPNTPQETCDLIEELGLDGVLLRHQTLVSQGLDEEKVPFFLPGEDGQIVQLLDIHLETTEFTT